MREKWRQSRWAKRALAGVILLAFGVARLSWEGALEKEWRELHLRAGAVDLSVREQLGQLSYVAALGGFRSLIASLLSLRGFIEWENVDWVKLESTYGLITRLQPRSAAYWDEGAWHLAYNAAAYYFLNREMRPVVARHLGRQYLDKGRDMLLEGIRNNPDDYLLHQRLAEIYRNKYGDHCAAAESYLEAASREGAPLYCRRFGAYELAECPGREAEAYEMLAELYRESPRHHKPTLIGKLGELEEKLAIPPSRRVLPVKPD